MGGVALKGAAADRQRPGGAVGVDRPAVAALHAVPAEAAVRHRHRPAALLQVQPATVARGVVLKDAAAHRRLARAEYKDRAAALQGRVFRVTGRF